MAESGIAVELTDPQIVTSQGQEEHMTVEFEPETQTVQLQQPELVRKFQSSNHERNYSRCIDVFVKI